MKKRLFTIIGLLLFALLAACEGNPEEVISEVATRGADGAATVAAVATDVADGPDSGDEVEVEATPEPEEPTAEPVVEVAGDPWSGSTVANDGSALGNVSITINEAMTQSDGSGSFALDVPPAEDGRYVITAEADGFLPISQIHIGAAVQGLTLDFQPVETFTVDPTQPIDVTDSSGTQIEIAPNSLETENGEPPVGDVTMEVYTYDLANEEMVGDMSGTNDAGELVSMESAGAFYASFEDEGGAELNLMEGATAEISVPVEEERPDEVLTVWSYDEETGLWVEESVATTEDGRYVATVSHFSYWNFDWEKRDPACIKLDIDADYLAANNPLSVRAVLQTNPVRVRDLLITDEINVLINLPANTNVQFFAAGESTPFNTTSSGMPWGGTGVPAFPYDACNGVTEVVPAPPEPTTGTLTGIVTDGVTGNPIANAEVCIQGIGLCATTGADGRYSIADAPAGEQQLSATAEGYIAVDDQAVTVVAGDSVSQPIVLSPELAEGEIRIVLTWGTQPSDLDSYLWLPDGTEINYNSRGRVINGAILDLDDTDGEGPETFTISERQDGTYTYAVENFSNRDGSATPLNQSGATVRVYVGERESTFTVPTSGDGNWWHIFDIDGATGAITPVNMLVDSAPQ